MAKQTNPLANITKRLGALQVKSTKLNEEILALAALAASESKKLEDAALLATEAKKDQPKAPKMAKAKPQSKAGVARVAATKDPVVKSSNGTSDVPKKRGRPRKI